MPSNPPEDVVTFAAEGVRKRIMSGDYGPGYRLVEADLCAEFEISRFTARLALRELARERLVELQRNRGARVRQVTITEAIEIEEVRIALESLTIRRAVELLQPEHLRALTEIGTSMEEAVACGDDQTYWNLSGALHELIQDIAGHETAARVLADLKMQLGRRQIRAALRPGRPPISLPQHQKIIAALIARDADTAEEAIREHLGSVVDALVNLSDDGEVLVAP